MTSDKPVFLAGRARLAFCWLFLCSGGLCQSSDARRPVDYVDPFIGVDGGGHVVPGASLPFGMVKLSPDCDLDRSNSGYDSARDIIGFSHVHVSGTGGPAKYGNILVMATIGDIDLSAYSSPKSGEIASPGYFGVTLAKYGIRADLTATARTGFHQYTFPAAATANILIDAGSFLGLNSHRRERQLLVGSEVKILSESAVEGYSRVRGGWNMGEAYTVYFYAEFETPAIGFGTWKDQIIHPANRAEFDSGQGTGAYFIFSARQNQVIRLKVAISYISCQKAKANLENESPGWDFDQVRRAAEAQWNRLLGTVMVEGGSDDQKKVFYTALYHAMLMPTDRTGENPKWLSTEPNYDDFYAIWDTFRSGNPLLALLMPSREVDLVRSLIDIYEHEGYMPDARSGNCNGLTQGGSNCDIVVADAFVKGLKGIDYEKAFQAMIKNAEVPPGGDERKEGRGGIADYNTLGYISTNFERSGSRTVEYANDDWAIAQVARGLGKMEVFNKHRRRASNWQNLWRPVQSHGATGFIMPRRADGTWADEVPQYLDQAWKNVTFTEFTGGSWTDVFYESNSWEYSLYVPQDVKQLIEKCGGREAFVARLDTFFGNNYFNVTNEPGFFAPLLYVYAGRPDKTAETVARIRGKYYNSSRSGLPGNDDSGAMSSSFVFHAMGFYPNAGQDVYIISSPVFDRTTIRMENGRSLEIVARNRSEKNIYVQSATLNGHPLERAWFRHSEISNGAILEFAMGPEPTSWGRSSPPPSMSDSN